MTNVKFKSWDTVVGFGMYGNKRLAIVLRDAEDGSPIATATVNLPDVELGPDEVIIKDYSENEGMLEALMAAGVVSPPVRIEATGFVFVPVCKLLLLPTKEAK